jgi:hypothetical protein
MNLSGHDWGAGKGRDRHQECRSGDLRRLRWMPTSTRARAVLPSGGGSRVARSPENSSPPEGIPGTRPGGFDLFSNKMTDTFPTAPAISRKARRMVRIVRLMSSRNGACDSEDGH